MMCLSAAVRALGRDALAGGEVAGADCKSGERKVRAFPAGTRLGGAPRLDRVAQGHSPSTP
jgi:hypothetical protein